MFNAVVYSFTTIQIYTTLKLPQLLLHVRHCFTTIQIYTTLKHIIDGDNECFGFTTIQIYTTLKLIYNTIKCFICFTTIQIYTTLKPQIIKRRVLCHYNIVNLYDFIHYHIFNSISQQFLSIIITELNFLISSGCLLSINKIIIF